jgi:NAD(P)-dependent dehydrogenase (short-subunit alcohol dehydrogenase family)
MSYDLNQKIALVTGANRGIGKAIVEALIASGVKKVYLAVRNLDNTKELVAQFKEKVVPVHIDMTDAASILKCAQTATDVQILVNNAGVLEVADPMNPNAVESFQKELDVNAFGLIRIAQAFAPQLEKNGHGVLVQLNSVASIKNFTGFTTYSASKAASYSITQGLKEVLAPKNIQVLSVHPGPIATEMAVKAGIDDIADPVNMVSEGIVKAIESGDFHLFPDTMAKEFEAAYSSYAKNVIEVEAPAE